MIIVQQKEVNVDLCSSQFGYSNSRLLAASGSIQLDILPQLMGHIAPAQEERESVTFSFEATRVTVAHTCHMTRAQHVQDHLESPLFGVIYDRSFPLRKKKGRSGGEGGIRSSIHCSSCYESTQYSRRLAMSSSLAGR